MERLVKATQDTDIYDESIEQNLNAVRECKTHEEMVALLKTTNKLMLVFMADLPDNGISRLTKQDLIDEVIVRINQERRTAGMLKQVQESKTAVEVSAILEYATTSQMLDIAKKLSISAYFNEFSTKAELVKLIAEKIRELVGEEAEAENDLRVLEDAYEQHRLVDFSGKFLDIRYVEISDIESARERVRLLNSA